MIIMTLGPQQNNDATGNDRPPKKLRVAPNGPKNIEGFGGLLGTTFQLGKQTENKPKQKRPLRRRVAPNRPTNNIRRVAPNRPTNNTRRVAPSRPTNNTRRVAPSRPTVTGGIINTMKKERQNMINSKLKSYNNIRKDMQFNERNMSKVSRFGEMGGYWTFNGKDIHFFFTGYPGQTVNNATQFIMLDESKMKPNQHPWHTHPHPIKLRGFWPSIEDMNSILNLPEGKYHLIITIHGTWVLSKSKDRNNTLNYAFNNTYKRFEQFFGGIVGTNKNGKKVLLQNGRAQELYEIYKESKKLNTVHAYAHYENALNNLINEVLPEIRKDWRKIGIEMQFFKNIIGVKKYLQNNMTKNRLTNNK